MPWGQRNILHLLQNALSVDDIAHLEVFTFAEAAALPTYYPGNTEEAQYNFSFPIAAALVAGEVGPRQVLDRLYVPEIQALMDRIEIIAETRFQHNFPEKAESEVRITTVDGKRYRSGAVTARWDAHISPPSDRELEDKFIRLVVPILGHTKAEKLIKTIWEFEELDTLYNFI